MTERGKLIRESLYSDELTGNPIADDVAKQESIVINQRINTYIAREHKIEREARINESRARLINEYRARLINEHNARGKDRNIREERRERRERGERHERHEREGERGYASLRSKFRFTSKTSSQSN